MPASTLKILLGLERIDYFSPLSFQEIEVNVLIYIPLLPCNLALQFMPETLPLSTEFMNLMPEMH